MGRLKFILFGLLTALGLLIVAMIVAVLTFDPNDYRERIEQAVYDSTGRTLTIGGELQLSLLPWLAVEVEDVTLSNREGFGDEPMFAIERASLALRLMPLFSGRLEVGNVELAGTRVRAMVNAAGENNWSDMTETSASTDLPDNADDNSIEVTVGDESGDIETVDIAGISITDANVLYIDEVAEARFDLSNFNFVSGPLRSGQPIEFEGSFSVATDPQALSGNIRYSAKLSSPAEGEVIDIASLVIEGDVAGEAVSELPVGFNLANTRIDLQAGTVVAEQFRIALAEFVATGKLNASGLDDDLAVSAAVEVPAFSPKAVMSRLDVEVPETSDPNAMSVLKSRFDVELSEKEASLSQLSVTLDDTTFTGDAKVVLADILSYQFNLAGDQINVDRYLAPASESEAADEVSMDDTAIPGELLDGLNVDGSLRLAEATMNGMTFGEVELGISVANQRARLHPIAARLFDGAYAGDIRIDARRSEPTLSLDERIEGVNLEPLAVALFDTQNLSGTIDGRFTLNGTGATLGAVRQTLAGDIAFSLADGALEGRDIWYEVRRARALFKKEAPPEASANPRTEFSDVNATGVVRNGVISNDDFRAVIPFMQLTGRGDVNLAIGELDYRVDARVLERPDFVDVPAEELDEYTEAVIPIKISGALSDPSIRPDINALVRQQAQQVIDEKKDEIKDRLLDKLGLGRDEEAANDESAEGDEEAVDPEDALKDEAKKALEDLFRR